MYLKIQCRFQYQSTFKRGN